MTRSQARTHRLPLWPFQLALLLVSAAITVAVLWLGLALLLSFTQYIPSEVLP